jgi:hypothetical protein
MKLIKNALVHKAELPSSTALETHLKEKPQTLNPSSVITELCDMLGYKETEQEKEAV